MHSGGERDTVQLIAPNYQLAHTYGAAVEQQQPPPTLSRPTSRCCSCLLRPFLFSGASPVERLDHTKCSAQERQQVLQEISRAWQTQVGSDQHYRDHEALQAPLGLSALLITAHWVTDKAAAARPTGISVPAIQVQLQWLVRLLINRWHPGELSVRTAAAGEVDRDLCALDGRPAEREAHRGQTADSSINPLVCARCGCGCV